MYTISQHLRDHAILGLSSSGGYVAGAPGAGTPDRVGVFTASGLGDYGWMYVDTTFKRLVIGDGVAGNAAGVTLVGGAGANTATITIDGGISTGVVTMAAPGTSGRWIMTGNTSGATLTISGRLDVSGDLTHTGTKVGFYNVATIARPTNAVAAAAFVANTSAIADDSATWGGYTAGQVVAALKALGLLT